MRGANWRPQGGQYVTARRNVSMRRRRFHLGSGGNFGTGSGQRRPAAALLRNSRYGVQQSFHNALVTSRIEAGTGTGADATAVEAAELIFLIKPPSMI